MICKFFSNIQHLDQLDVNRTFLANKRRRFAPAERRDNINLGKRKDIAFTCVTGTTIEEAIEEVLGLW